LLAGAAIVQDEAEMCPKLLLLLNVKLSPGDPAAEHVTGVPNGTVLGEQLSGGTFAARATDGVVSRAIAASATTAHSALPTLALVTPEFAADLMTADGRRLATGKPAHLRPPGGH
jgi:hypothetical protein